MAIQLNEQIRDEAKKMSEFVVEDTKRTVEMLEWMKSKVRNENVVGDIINAGVDVLGGNVKGGLSMVAEEILPRLRDRQSAQIIKEESFTPINDIRKANEKITHLRKLVESFNIDAIAIDDLCYDVQVILSDVIKKMDR